MKLYISSKVNVTPRDGFLFNEAIQMGEVEIREALINLIIDAEVMVDADELKRIAAIPEVAQALQQVVEPQMKQYKAADWRAKRPVMRDLQWQQKPVIDYIINTLKADILQAIKGKLAGIPNDWTDALLADAKYGKDPKALQLSQSEDKKWRSIYVTITADLGSAEDRKGFIGKLAAEFENAVTNNQIQHSGDTLVFQSSLTGFETAMKSLDPYSGAKLSDTKVHGWDVADEKGYDKEIKNAFVDHISEMMGSVLGTQARVTNIGDDGKITASASMPTDELEQPGV